MPGDTESFGRSLNRWHAMHERQAYSLPESEGYAAYIHSSNGSLVKTASGRTESWLVEYYAQEAVELAKEDRLLGKNALVLAGFNLANLERVFTDTTISDVVMVGDGSFSSIYLDETNAKGYRKKFYWKDVAGMADHLKTGRFLQRTCGIFDARLNVPFGAFAMSDHSDLHGVVGDSFGPEDFSDMTRRLEEESKIVRIYGDRALTLHDIKERFCDEVVDESSLDPPNDQPFSE